MPRNTPGLSPEQAQEIAKTCYAEVLAYCRRHAPSGHDAADLAQETFLRFVRAQGYCERGKPIAYLMRIARSVCVDASRKKQLESVPLDFDVVGDDSCGTEADALTRDEQMQQLERALASLPDEVREAVELRYSAGLGVAEVAQALGISRFAVRRRINAALAQLKTELEAYEAGDMR